MSYDTLIYVPVCSHWSLHRVDLAGQTLKSSYFMSAEEELWYIFMYQNHGHQGMGNPIKE